MDNGIEPKLTTIVLYIEKGLTVKMFRKNIKFIDFDMGSAWCGRVYDKVVFSMSNIRVVMVARMILICRCSILYVFLQNTVVIM